jgi:hypothetical protein
MGKRDPVHAFPTRLHEILATPEYNEVIAWLPHGQAWKIRDKSRFEKTVIPHHFRHSRYASFMRQVRTRTCLRFQEPQLGTHSSSLVHILFVVLALQQTIPCQKQCKQLTNTSALMISAG